MSEHRYGYVTIAVPVSEIDASGREIGPYRGEEAYTVASDALRAAGFEVVACSSDDPAEHNGDTCPIHEGDTDDDGLLLVADQHPAYYGLLRVVTREDRMVAK